MEENLKSIDTLLKQIDNICLRIQKKALKTLKTVKYEGMEIAKDIQESKPHIDLQTLLTMLQDESIKLSEESEKISEEIKIFNIALANGSDIAQSGCEILRDAWFGDAYDGLSRYNALVALKNDLKNQEKDINIEYVIEKIIGTGTIEKMTATEHKKKKRKKKSNVEPTTEPQQNIISQEEMQRKILEDFPSSPSPEPLEGVNKSSSNIKKIKSRDNPADKPRESEHHDGEYYNSEYYDSDEYPEDSN